MHIRTFRAASLQDALAEIRKQMGPEASVLHTRQVRDGLLGWLGKTHVEVTAGLHEDDEKPRIGRMQTGSQANSTLSPTDPVPQLVSKMRDGMVALEVPHTTASAWIQDAERSAQASLGIPSGALSQNLLEQNLRHQIRDQIRCGGPVNAPDDQRRIVALVGPTGVGKTTTMAKLAAGFRLQQKRRVGLLTIDTYRIAAVQQLRAYAEIMDLPMSVVERPEEMLEGLQKLGDVDLILIDTAGRSPLFKARIRQLKDMLAAAEPDETHLVISATSSPKVVQTTLAGFAAIHPTATILTKLDETQQILGVLSALQHTSPPLSYITTGQQVPDDIETADAGLLTDRYVSLIDTDLPAAA